MVFSNTSCPKRIAIWQGDYLRKGRQPPQETRENGHLVRFRYDSIDCESIIFEMANLDVRPEIEHKALLCFYSYNRSFADHGFLIFPLVAHVCTQLKPDVRLGFLQGATVTPGCYISVNPNVPKARNLQWIPPLGWDGGAASKLSSKESLFFH